jgi:hypothetical protein
MKDSELEELSPLEKKVFKKLQKLGDRKISEAVPIIAREEAIHPDEAAKLIYKLWKKGFIDLRGSEPHKNIFKYLFSVEGAWFHIITIVLLITVALVFLVSEPPLLYLRYILGSLFILYLPGYALIEALYPRGDELEPLERLALSIGLSLALVPLVGLILNYTPWGIRLTPVTLSLAMLTETLITYALFRKYRYYRLETSA